MRDRITIRYSGTAWVLAIPGFGFSPFAEIEFTKWSDAINYLDWRPQGSSSSFERAHQERDAIAPKPEWSPLQ